MLCFFPYLAGPARLPPLPAAPIENEAALPAFLSQGARMEALRAHNPGVRRASEM